MGSLGREPQETGPNKKMSPGGATLACISHRVLWRGRRSASIRWVCLGSGDAVVVALRYCAPSALVSHRRQRVSDRLAWGEPSSTLRCRRRVSARLRRLCLTVVSAWPMGSPQASPRPPCAAVGGERSTIYVRPPAAVSHHHQRVTHGLLLRTSPEFTKLLAAV